MTAGAGTSAFTPTVEELERLLGQARAARRPFEGDWLLNLAFFEGEQWVGWNGHSLFRPRLPANRVTITDNRILPVVEKEVARLTKQKPTYLAVPGNTDEDAISAASLAEQVLEFLWRDLEIQPKFYEALKWSRTVCAGFLKVVWDSSLGDGTEIVVGPDDKPLLDGDQRPMRADQIDLEAMAAQLGPDAVRARRINRGNIRVSVCSPFQIFPDPLASSLAECEWLIEESVLSEDAVFERYGRHVRADTEANPGLVQARMSELRSSGGYKGVKVNELWRRPSRRYPNGLRVVWAGRGVLEVDDHPFDPMPYVMLRGIDVPGRFWPLAVSQLLRPLNAELNKRRSQLAENGNRIGNPTLLASRTAAMDPDQFERQIGVPGGVVYYDDPSAVPAYLEAPQMPAYISQEIDRIEAAIQEVAGQHEISNAQVPAGVTSASAINLLMEADDTRLGPAATDLALQLAYLGTKKLRLVDSFYTDERKISLVGEDKAWEIKAFRGSLLRGTTQVMVQDGSLIPQSKAARQAAMMQVLNLCLQNGVPLQGRQLARFIRDFGVGGLDHLIEGYNDDEQQVNRENRLLSMGEQVQVNPFDNDEAHLDGHEAFEKTAAFFQLPAPIQALHLAHTDEHRRRLDAAQQAQQQQEMAPQLAQTGAQIASQQAQSQQQMQQQAEQHAQRVGQQDELHAQRLQQQAQQQAVPQ